MAGDFWAFSLSGCNSLLPHTRDIVYGMGSLTTTGLLEWTLDLPLATHGMAHSFSVLKTENDVLYLYNVRTQNPAIPTSGPRPTQPQFTRILSTLINNRGLRRLGLSVLLTIHLGICTGFFLVHFINNADKDIWYTPSKSQ